jgi:hypothetical protein
MTTCLSPGRTVVEHLTHNCEIKGLVETKPLTLNVKFDLV